MDSGSAGGPPIYSPANVGFVGGAGFSGEAGRRWLRGFRWDQGSRSIHGILQPGFPAIEPDQYSEARSNPRHIIAPAITISYFHQRVVFHACATYRPIGTIAIPADEFAAGHVITPATAVRPTAQQWRTAQMIPHPSVAPAQTSVVPRPVNSVPVPAERPAFVTSREPQPAPQGGAGASAPPSLGGRSQLIARTPPPPEPEFCAAGGCIEPGSRTSAGSGTAEQSEPRPGGGCCRHARVSAPSGRAVRHAIWRHRRHYTPRVERRG